ncbi:hypothetical protein ETH_00043570, partial [Eimeria tenella]
IEENIRLGCREAKPFAAVEAAAARAHASSLVSALDAKSERQVQQALDSVLAAANTTTLVVAHRLTAVQNLDEVVVLDSTPGQGARVVQRGPPQELLRDTGGPFYRLFQAQAAQEGPPPALE